MTSTVNADASGARARHRVPLRPVGRAGASRLLLDGLYRAIILARDGHRCRRCGATKRPGRGGGLQAAHIKPKGSHPALRYVLDNGVTLCASCHIYGPAAWHRDPSAAIKWARLAVGSDLLERLDGLAAARGRKGLDKEAMRLYLESELARYREGTSASDRA